MFPGLPPFDLIEPVRLTSPASLIVMAAILALLCAAEAVSTWILQ